MWRLIERYPFLSFLVISLVLRALSFSYSVIDHDESTYLVIAQQLLKGKTLYVDVWDTKPAGIFILFAGILKLFGQTIMAVRLSGCAVVAFTGYLLYRASKKLGAEHHKALLAGLIYLVLMSAYRFGMAINTEVFFNFFVIAGFYVFLRKRNFSYFTAGLLWGMGFIVKYVVLFDVFAILLCMFVFEALRSRRLRIIWHIRTYLLVAVGFAMPFLSCHLYFFLSGSYDDFYFATFVVPALYKSKIAIGDALHFFFQFHLKFLPALFLFYAGLFNKVKKDDHAWVRKWLPFVWFAVVWVPVILPGKFFDHYYAQLLLPVSWLAAEGMTGGRIGLFFEKQRKWIFIALPLLVLGLIVGNQGYFYTKEDTAKKIAHELKGKLGKDETIYAGKRLQVLYFLLQVDPPSKYVHPTLLTFSSHIRTLGVIEDEEFFKILEKKPAYMAFPAPHPNRWFREQVDDLYEPVSHYSRSVVLYKRKVQTD